LRNLISDPFLVPPPDFRGRMPVNKVPQAGRGVPFDVISLLEGVLVL
jgi:hypothetical protein